MFIVRSALKVQSSFRSDIHFAPSELKLQMEGVGYKYFVPNGTRSRRRCTNRQLRR